MKRLRSFLFAMVITFPASSMDKIEKAFSRLAVHDYFAARQLFSESMKKKLPAASYGLSKIAMRNNNPFYNLDSARYYILVSDSSFALLEQKERVSYKERYGLDSLEIKVQRDSVARLAFVALDTTSVDDYNQYLELYPFAADYKIARTQRDILAYEIARRVNTSKSYIDFINRYHTAIQVKEARQHYEERLFAEETQAGTPEAYEAFLHKYPDNSYNVRAEDSLYSILTRNRNPADYYSFAKKHPGNRNGPDAWMKLYHRYLDEKGADSFRQFLVDYPDFPYPRRVADDYRLYNTILLPIRNETKWGFITSEGKPAVPVEYSDVDRFSEGLCAAARNGRYGYINKAGKTEIDYQYDEAEMFENGAALVRKDGKALLINRDNEQILAGLHDDIGSPREDRIVFLDGELYGYADEKGIVFAPQFETAGDYKNGMAVAGSNEKVGVIDRAGRWILPPEFGFIEMEDNGLLRVMRDGRFGLYNRFGEAILPVEYDAVGRYSNGLALVARNMKSGYVNDSAALVIPMTYDFNNESFTEAAFREGYAVITLKKKAGLIDTSGNRILPAVYEDLRFASDTLPVAARKKGKWGYVSMENKTVVDFRYEDAQPFHGSLAVVKLKGKEGVIDTTGKLRVAAEYNSVRIHADGVEIRKMGTGLLSTTLVPLVAPEYDSCTPAAPGIFRFERQKKFGYYSVTKKDWIWKEEGL